MEIQRRTLIIAGSALVAGLAGALLPTLGLSDNSDVAAPSADALLPSAPGTLSAAEMNRLWAVNREVSSRWQFEDMTRDDWAAFVQAKTGSNPSYLAEYRHALDLLGPGVDPVSVGRYIDRSLGTAPTQRDAVRFERVRRYVIGEFIGLAIIKGGFMQFGPTNYRGYIAGSRVYRRSGAE